MFTELRTDCCVQRCGPTSPSEFSTKTLFEVMEKETSVLNVRAEITVRLS